MYVYLQALLMIFGTLGNGIILIVFEYQRRQRKPMKTLYFINWLAIADVAYLWSGRNIPFKFVSTGKENN